MAKSKEQKQQEAIERNRRDLHIHRDMYLRYSPGTPLYKELVATEGKENADEKFRQYDRRLTQAAQAAHCDRHGNPIDLSWKRLTDEVVIVNFKNSSEAWKLIIVDSREKMFVQNADDKFLFVEYANWYEWGGAQRRIGDRIYPFEHQVIFSDGHAR